MTPAVFWILVAFICLLIGTLIIHWGTRRHDGKEPDSRPPLVPDEPSSIELVVMEFHNLNLSQWRNKTPAEQWGYTNRYFKHRGL